MKNKIYRFFLIVLLINIVIILYSSNPCAPSEFKIKDDLSITEDWKLVIDENNGIISLKNVISQRDCKDPYILLCTHVPVNIYVNNEFVIGFSDIQTIGNCQAINSAWRLARLPKDCYEKEIRLDFKSNDFKSLFKGYKSINEKFTYHVEGIKIGGKQQLLREIIFQNIGYIIFAILFMIISVILVLVCSIAKRKYNYNLNYNYISLGMICFSIWILCDCQILMIWLNTVTIYYIKYSCIFILPIFMFRYTEIEFDTMYKSHIGVLCIFHTFCVILAIIFGIFSLLPLYILAKIMWGIFFINEFSCILFLLPDVDQNSRVRNVFMGHLITYLTIFIYAIVFFEYKSKVETKYLAVGASLFLIYFILIGINKIFITIDSMYARKLQEIQSKGQIKYYKILENNDNILKKIIHDTKNHWRVLIRLLEEDKTHEAFVYGKEIINSLEKSDDKTVIRTGNSFFDAVLTIKMQYARERNINIESNIMVIKDMKIDALDYSILFGNILDNAIEACEKTENKWIKIKIFYKKNMLICKISNSSKNEIIPKYTFPLTTKKNKLMHGIGLKNVKEIVEKYNGNFDFKNENGVAESSFVLYIV